ncbi:MAG TPA: 4Fe-4S dicluster domain-containing protein [Bryobacteraceae bacterium]|nr:4Fe-4S dicluster domain-containing protein [Bryobacteraceae bacterium]
MRSACGELLQIQKPEPETTRRDFLSVAGFAIGAAALASCRAPVQNAIPLLAGSDQLVPGVSSWYATTCGGCPASCSLLAKQRDGRPIKIEGNDRSALFGGGTCATGQATVLSLYDGERLNGPRWKGQSVSWQQMDQLVLSLLPPPSLRQRVVLLSNTINSPSTLRIIEAWRRRYPGFRHVTYDAISLSAIRSANKQCFGLEVVPHYAFEKARVIVGMEADFLGTWLSPVEFAQGYARSHSPETSCLHLQVESGLSLTGSKADIRIAAAPSELGMVAVALLRRVARKARMAGVSNVESPIADPALLDFVADRLWENRGKSLIVSGVQDTAAQTVINALNEFLGNIGATVDLACPSFQRNGDDIAMTNLVAEMNRGEVHTLILYGVNPVYDYAGAELFAEGLKKTQLSISLADTRDETSSQAVAICPDHHFLESWGDAEPVDSHFSLRQPLISPLFDTRAAPESMLRWLGNTSTHYTYLRDVWKASLFPRQTEIGDFELFWERALRDGVLTLPARHPESAPVFRGDWAAAEDTILHDYNRDRSHLTDQDATCELHLYESVSLRDGRHANNPWLQELPDPITTATWGNFASIAPELARRLNCTEGDVVSLRTGSRQVDIPVLIQPGQHQRTISVALGYGREEVGKVGRSIGINAFRLRNTVAGPHESPITAVTIEKSGRREPIARTQGHFSMEGRPIALETTVHDLAGESGPDQDRLPTLWTEPMQGAHAWGMAIDLNACTGCSACVVACQAENNVPVVGKDQVQRGRIMHWIRIDHYYHGDEANPKSIHQPMMCQHCGHAPCETVCPVLATTTSSEGINQQVYNRCIGTRYCANNCPYKVRRFNWYNYTDNAAFDFNMSSPLGRMVLNPDVVVRSRGVMEKCNLCVQRIQSAKNLALEGQRQLADGEIQTACQQACATHAIVFGDLKDFHSRVSQLHRSPRNYLVLGELGTRPNVSYLKRIRTTMEAH